MAYIGVPFNQEIYFDNGTNRTFFNVIRLEMGTMMHIETKDGYEYIINPKRILFIRKWKIGEEDYLHKDN